MMVININLLFEKVVLLYEMPQSNTPPLSVLLFMPCR